MVDLRQSSKAFQGRRRRRYRLRAENVLGASAPLRLRTPAVAEPRRSIVLDAPFRRSGAALSGRRFLIVTAPFGPFASALAAVLESRGAEVARMIFNAGDAISWRRRGAIVFKGDAQAWASRLPDVAQGFTSSTDVNGIAWERFSTLEQDLQIIATFGVPVHPAVERDLIRN